MENTSKHKTPSRMKTGISTKGLLLIGLAAGLLSTEPATGQNGEEKFKQVCAACHSIGKGRLVGPDLQGVNTRRKEDWIIKFVKNSTELINSGDAEAKAIFDEYNGMMMPPQSLSDAEIKSIIAYIASQSPAAPVASAETTAPAAEAAPETPGRKAIEATKEEIEKGAQLFEGTVAFKNGGVSCVSCHNVANEKVIPGGLLAKDLTTVFSRMGDAGVTGIINAPPFPAMAQSYKDRPLTEEEIYNLTAFFAYADKVQVSQKPDSGGSILLFGGLGGLIAFLAVIAFIWLDRKNKSVNKDIYDRQVKSI